MPVFILGPSGDVFRRGDGTSGDDEVFGEGGGDYLFGGGGSDALYGGEGSDWLYVDGHLPGDEDDLFGGDGDDRLWVYFDAVLGQIDGGAGTDILELSPGVTGISTRLTLSEDFIIQRNGVDVGPVRGIEAISFRGGSRRDDVQGGDLSDTLKSGGGDDTLLGAGGDDWIEINGVGALHIDGGAGIDVLTLRMFDLLDGVLLQLGPVQRLVIGTLESVLAGIDRMDGFTTEGRDTIIGGQLDDQIQTNGGDDSLSMGDGNDSVWGGAGDDIIRLGGGDDFGDSGTGSDRLFGGAGNDSLNANLWSYVGGPTETYGGHGDDTIRSHEGADRLFGGQGNDSIDARGNDEIFGGAGDDDLSGGNGGAAALDAGRGDDRVSVAVTNEVGIADGGDGDDVLVVNPNYFLPYTPISAGVVDSTYVVMSEGVVVLRADRFESIEIFGAARVGDTLAGGTGNDTLQGQRYGNDEREADRLSGRNGNDLLIGMGGDDTLNGDRGNDTLQGDKGNDRLNGGLGRDVLIGGPGADVFEVDSFEPGGGAANRDRIRHFAQGADVIDLSALDADTATPGLNDAFVFVGGGPFTAAGQVRAVADAATTTVTADMNGDGVADLVLVLSGVFVLGDADFLL